MSLKSFYLSKSDWGLLALTTIYVTVGYIIAATFDALHFYSPVKYIGTAIEFTKVLILAYVLFWGAWAISVMIRIRPKNLKAYLWEDLQKNALNKERYINALPVFIAFIFILSTFTSLKTMIPFVHPFEWDTTFANWDAAIHGGLDPWRVLHPVLGYPLVTLAINAVYNLWLGVLYVILYWQLLSLKDPQTRMQFFYSVLFCFALNGSFIAMMLSSAGPCYFEQITGGERFLPLLEYLQSLGTEENKIWALRNQDYLWELYTTKENGIGAGISAMPSVHVSFALICMMVGLRSNKFWRITAITFFIFILLGSIHLGWHYALDGYIAILLTLPIWWGSGWIVKKLSNNQTH